ncbi:response regulator transcription factor [Rheinheimera nanhaiensis]|uniref:LuxR family transcriptional regulator, csgAB operon transcriptional regulatory protein n=1 Tax=Rheinheimera nanhaiensis E407-8 TaxID=562729 RepID=I1DYJ5_9GAMM|nr:response regulator transcription factor [Rheinheimera nanhaiensis]GAB59123.1 LuxR family transcriptional regulator, csgAB operon transcriptional regulatory protein [Rheinheimera nanhaiensis E407-8]
MDKFSRLIVVSEHESLHNLTLLAQSVGIKVEQSSKIKLLCAGNYRPDVLVACPYNSADYSKKGPSAELHYLLQRCSLFLFQAERSLIDPMQALHAGIRGVIYRDEQLDRVMTALKTMMDGQLYYARPVMSAVVDQFLAQQAANRPAAIVTPENNLLTRQEKRIIQLVAEGARNKEIAEKLHISAHTVKAHLSTIFRKTQSRNRVELLRWLQQPQRQEPVAGFRLN